MTHTVEPHSDGTYDVFTPDGEHVGNYEDRETAEAVASAYDEMEANA